MSAATFRAHCARGHERIDFEGAAGAMLFEAHMKAEHKGRRLVPGGPVWHGSGLAPGWTAGGNIAKPYQWRAPAVPEDWETRLSAVLTAHAEHVVDGGVPDGAYRYDNGAGPPYEALPANVRSILRAVVDRGEFWAVKVSGDTVGVTMGRTPTDQAGLTIFRGKVRPQLTRLRRPEDHHYVIAPKLADVRAAFGPDWTPRLEEVAS